MKRGAILSRFGSQTGCALGAGALALTLITGAAAAGAKAPHRQELVGSATELRPAKERDVLDRIGDWMNRSIDNLKDSVTRTFGAAERIGDRTGKSIKDAADEATGNLGSMRAMPDMGLVRERERCAVAANGAPNCRMTAMAICRRHGFTQGKTVDIQTEEKCPVAAMLGAHKFGSAQCRTETYVLSSMCE